MQTTCDGVRADYSWNIRRIYEVYKTVYDNNDNCFYGRVY